MPSPSKIWPLQEAKAKFSKLVRLAQTEGPQTVTVHGKPAVVVTKAGDAALSGISAAARLRELQSGPPLDFDIPDWEAEGAVCDTDLR